MSAIPTGLILEAVNRGEATLPALKRATGFDYPVLLTALEGDLSMAVRREETATGALRFYPLNKKPEFKVDRIPVGPLCVKCRVECKRTHQAGTAFVGGETRWMCPQCKERFPGTHAKGGKVGVITDDEHAIAKERVNEIIAHGQPCPRCGGKKSAEAEMCRNCFVDPSKNGRHKEKTGRPPIEIDLRRLEELLADPEQRVTDIAEVFGTNRNTFYYRRDTDPEFKAAYDRGMARREEAIARQLEEAEAGSKDAVTEAGLAGVEVAPGAEEPSFKLAVDLDEEDTGPVRLQMLPETSPVGDTAERPFIPALTPQSPTLEEARKAQVSGISYKLEMFGDFPPSVVLKKIVWDDDFFMVSYETLLAILDDDMTDEEKNAVWLLLRYLKRVEKDDLKNKFMAEWAAKSEALRAVNGD